MENNQTNITNLENNIRGVTPPIFNSVTIQSEQSYVVTHNEVELIQQNVSSVETIKDETTEKIKESVILDEDITLPTVLLREMVAQARKVGVSNNMQPLSEVLNLIIDENGITMKTTSGRGKQDFECTDKKYISKTKLEVSLDIRIFGEYLNVEKNNTVTLKFVESENTLYITTKTGVRKFPQRMDGSTHQPVIHTLQYPYKYDDMIPVDYERLTGLIDLSSPARDLANKLVSFSYLQGLYCGDDILVASDGNVMTIQPNQTEFRNEIFFLNNDICKLITTINFNPKTFRAGITKLNSFVSGITISDGRTTICGPIAVDNQFPVEAAKNYWNTTGFTQSIRFETKVLADVIKSVIPFIASVGNTVDKLAFDIQGDKVEIKCLEGSAKETLSIVNNTNYTTTTSILLPASKLEKVLQAVDSDSFEMLINPTADNCVCLYYNGIRNIVTTLTRD